MNGIVLLSLVASLVPRHVPRVMALLQSVVSPVNAILFSFAPSVYHAVLAVHIITRHIISVKTVICRAQPAMEAPLTTVFHAKVKYLADKSFFK
jgi:hypothetical protein